MRSSCTVRDAVARDLRRTGLSRWTGRGSLFRNGIAGAVATAADFALVAGLVGTLRVPLPIATFFGCVLGAVVNFSVNRYWAFGSRLAYGQAVVRYALVSGGSALLNAGLVAAIGLATRVGPMAVWGFARVMVFVGWNYPLHRRWVFPMSRRTAE